MSLQHFGVLVQAHQECSHVYGRRMTIEPLRFVYYKLHPESIRSVLPTLTLWQIQTHSPTVQYQHGMRKHIDGQSECYRVLERFF